MNSTKKTNQFHKLIPAHVPCNGCTACCQQDVVFLHPEYGDVLADYQTIPMTHPLTGRPGHRLAHRPQGGCIYLGDTGCTIHGKAPAMCKEFDCRRFFLGFKDRAQRRRAVREGMITADVLKAGQERLHTLPENTEIIPNMQVENLIHNYQKPK